VEQEGRAVLALLKAAQETLVAAAVLALAAVLAATAQTLIITILVAMVAVEGLHQHQQTAALEEMAVIPVEVVVLAALACLVLTPVLAATAAMVMSES